MPLRIYLIKKLFYFWLCWIFAAARSLSLVSESGVYFPFVARRLLTVVASLTVEHRI